MCIQSEATLEKKLIQQLIGQGYERVNIQNEDDLVINFKAQLERHNKCSFSDAEFKRIMNHLMAEPFLKKRKNLETNSSYKQM